MATKLWANVLGDIVNNPDLLSSELYRVHPSLLSAQCQAREYLTTFQFSTICFKH